MPRSPLRIASTGAGPRKDKPDAEESFILNVFSTFSNTFTYFQKFSIAFFLHLMFVIQHSKGRGHFIVTHYFTEFSVVAIKIGYTPGENNVAIVITVIDKSDQKKGAG